MNKPKAPDAERWLYAVPDLPPLDGEEQLVSQPSRPMPQLSLVVVNQSLETNAREQDDLSLSGRKFMYHLVQGLVAKGKGALGRLREKEEVTTIEQEAQRNTAAGHYAMYRWVGGPLIPGTLIAREPGKPDGSVRK
jgi:hypothetical protein